MIDIRVVNYERLYAFGRMLFVSCHIKDRKKEGLSVVYSEDKNGARGKPYQPMRFPIGEWKIVAAYPESDPLLAPCFIATDAHQTVKVWSLDDHGRYLSETTETIEDWGYGIHFDRLFETTDGCIHLYSEGAALWLANCINIVHDPITLHVEVDEHVR
jgi:hypothetical protein